MTTVLTHEELLREISTVEMAVCWALEYHENQAKANAAGHATWKVEYPPIVRELHDAKAALIVMRQQIEQVKRFSEKIQAAYADIKPPVNRNGFGPLTPEGLRRQYAKTNI